MAFNVIAEDCEQVHSDYACHLHNLQHNSYLSMLEVSFELLFSKSTHSSLNRLFVAGNVSIHLLTDSLPILKIRSINENQN